MTCIITYDIENNRVRTKLARFLESKGVRIQKSVFAVEIERHAFKGLLRQVEKITGKTGKVAVFRLCIGCRDNAINMNGEEKPFHVF
ncbi:MAG: CRISPR-associated endonuclease Cas2 [Nitrospirae bacterium]|nr:CRISPR-associated endonuclease Cas2 [Nitrospirota bacterium]